MVSIIRLFEFLLISKKETFDLSQVMRSYAPVACQKNGRLQPEFAVSVRRPDMDMGRLISLVGVEVKTERPDAQNCRHVFAIPHAMLQGNIFCRDLWLPPSRARQECRPSVSRAGHRRFQARAGMVAPSCQRGSIR